ncbi:hypothetical protein [Streptomyces spectabilis]|uniref:Fatty acid desaturase n=1 Tax=Streptomyces spectabilis TaxID=68270 RepID=A0A5P2XEH5_STRST|nr:hypothetical protein [Streptomyces spectabilis]MBB5109499.1 fatty acid desaturase [Streptomyces spectabilis]MCI3904630.1 hypothetical protein [Streptomyces spectabilis]QEV61709.1 hypothetical protein CP982_25845 [Streptomyces spectabilis]GGV54577.1 hypothetical protein GCM10010245_86270 [Streptomyces spectabilis]
MAQQEQLTPHDRRMHALMNRTEGEPLYRTAGRRRAVVVAHIALTVAAVAAWLGTVVGESSWAMWAMLGLLLPWCVATGVINGATRGLLELRPRALDERQRGERERVRARAHQAMTWLLLAAVVGTGLAGFSGVDFKALVFQVTFCVFIAQWLMPLWIAGLTARDEPLDEADDVAAGAAG